MNMFLVRRQAEGHSEHVRIELCYFAPNATLLFEVDRAWWTRGNWNSDTCPESTIILTDGKVWQDGPEQNINHSGGGVVSRYKLRVACATWYVLAGSKGDAGTIAREIGLLAGMPQPPSFSVSALRAIVAALFN